jgi:hypothetical protein
MRIILALSLAAGKIISSGCRMEISFVKEIDWGKQK